MLFIDFFLISGLFLSAVVDRPWRRFVDRRLVHYMYFYALSVRGAYSDIVVYKYERQNCTSDD